MSKPGWTTIVGILMLLIGGCGAFDKIGEINSDKFVNVLDNAMENSMEENKKRRADNSDSIKQIKYEEMDSADRKGLSILTDSIVVDSLNNVDMEATFKSALNVSDYRKKWMVRFGWAGLIVALLFILGGVLLLASKKYTIQVVLGTLALSLFLAAFQVFIYSSDDSSGKWIGVGANIGIAISAFVDMILLIIVGVSDKSYFKPMQITEDYYDDDQL